MKTILVGLVAFLASLFPVKSQGFINLNFEQAQIVIDPGQGARAAAAIPGWTAYISIQTNFTALTHIVYNTVSLGASSVDLMGTNGFYPAIQGRYSIVLQGNTGGQPSGAAIGQTGLIPLSAMSLLFWGGIGSANNPATVSFNDNLLTLLQIGSTANYNIYVADVSAYAGQIGQLLFSVPQAGGLGLDNIQFSSTAVPEPSALALAALGGLLFGLRSGKRTSP